MNNAKIVTAFYTCVVDTVDMQHVNTVPGFIATVLSTDSLKLTRQSEFGAQENSTVMSNWPRTSTAAGV